VLQQLLDAAIAITRADMGFVQLAADDRLTMVASRGFSSQFLRSLDQADPIRSPGSATLASGQRVVIEDIAVSPQFTGDTRRSFLDAGAHAVQSTPLVSREGRLVGVLSTHYRRPQRPSDSDLRLLDLLARQAADLIERARSEVALRQSETRLRLATSAGRLGIWDWDLATGAVTWSDTLYDIHGLAPGEFAGTFEAYQQLLHPDDHGLVGTALRRALDDDDPYELDFRILRPDGRIVWVSANGRVIRDPSGRPLRMVGATVDITERRKAEESRQHLAAIVQSSDDGIVGKSLDGIITSWNDGATRLYGYTAAEAIGQSVMVLVPPDRHEEEARILANLRAGRVVRSYETQRVRKDGRLIDISLTVSPVHDSAGTVAGMSAIARDVTDRKRTEASLRQRSERLRLLWIAASVPLTTDQPDAMMRTMFANIAPHAGLDAYFNCEVSESGDALELRSSEGLSEAEIAALARVRFGENISGAVAERRRAIVASNIQTSDDPMVQAARRFGFRAAVCSPLLSGGRLLGTLAFASRRKDRFEADEVEFLETISQYVTAASERMSLIRRLRDTDQRKNEFLATLAHELRNPLAPIRNALQIMRLTSHDVSAVKRARSMMERQLGHLVRLIDDLLDVSRITQGVLELRTERVALATVIASAVDTTRPLIDAAGHRLVVDLPRDPVYLEADPVRLAQVFANLLNNAVKYTPEGGRIEMGAERRGDTVSVTVRDSGVGIPPHALRSVFGMFARLGQPGRGAQEGLGVGLTLAQRLVGLHGGRIEAASEGAGCGAAFTVHLGTAPDEPVAGPPGVREDAEPAVQPGGRRILVADDNADAAESLALVLQLMGNEVRVAHDGREAVEAAAVFRPELILLDIGMPRLTGYEAARMIRQQPWGRDVVLVALTGWGQDEDKREALDAGFDHHFTKPVDPVRLQQFVRDFRPMTGGARH
jgi:PAS domain S-box-containing protein